MEDIEELLTKRGSVHGDAEAQFGVAQSLKYLMHTSPNWDELPDLHREALEMITLKMSRILVGDFNEADHWNDIAGYATVVSKRLPT